jgi:hypothetical protein
MNLRRHERPLLAALAAALVLGVAMTGLPTRADERQKPGMVTERAPTATWCADGCDAVVADWSLTAYHVIKAADGYQDPMAASRSLAMMHVAMHDAVNAVHPRYETYTSARPAPAAGADAAVAAIVAAHDVLLGLYPQTAARALLKIELEKTLFEAGTGPAVEQGIQLGRAVAAAMLFKRNGDGSASKEPYVLRGSPGQYQYTPPFDFAAAPHWRKVTPFALTGPAQFRSEPPPPLTSDEYVRDYDEVKRVGNKRADGIRTTDETHYAAFWYEFSDIGWNRVARIVSTRERQDLWERARTFALLNMALADSYIAGWDSKYLHNAWRPVTAIHRGGEDGNSRTLPDPAFEPLLPTPPVPDMPSTHSVLGMAAATVLAHAFGKDQIPFSFASPTARPDNPVRTFSSFSQAARENAESRVKAGIHFRHAIRAGVLMGKRIGEHVAQNALKRRGS